MKHFLTFTLIVLFTFLPSFSTKSQYIHQVSGTVTEWGTVDPLIGVSVTNLDMLHLGVPVGTVSDSYGRFTIMAKPNSDSLEFSLVGYKTKKLLARYNLDVYLEPED